MGRTPFFPEPSSEGSIFLSPLNFFFNLANLMGSVGSGNALPCRWPCILKELKYYGMLIRRNLENPGSGFPRFAPGFCGFRKCIALLMAMHFKVKSYEMLVCHVGPARSSQGLGGSGGNALPC